MKSNQPYLLTDKDPDYKGITAKYPNHTKIIYFKSGNLKSAFEKDLGEWVNAHIENGKYPLEIQKFNELASKLTLRQAFLLDDGPKIKSVTYAFTENSYSKIEDIVNKYIQPTK